MKDQYIYGQPLYGENNIQYETTGVEGAQFGTYEASNYLQEQNLNLGNVKQIKYQEYQKQPIYLNENQTYTQQAFLQQQNKQEQIFEYNPRTKIETNIQGYENYFQNQVQQPQQQNVFYQQPQTIQQQKYAQQPQIIQQQKYFQQPQIIQQQKYIGQPQTIQQQQKFIQQPQSIYQQAQKVHQQNYAQQPQTIQHPNYPPQPQNIQQQNLIQQQANLTRQMVQQPNVKPYSNVRQPPFASRNPHMKQQYQMPNNIQPQMNQPQQVQKLNEMKYNQQNLEQEKPAIESDFQPTIPLANSVLNQSKMPFQPNQNVPINPQAQQPQMQMQPNNMTQQNNLVAMRNPDYKMQQYGYMNNNNSHFVTMANPDWGYNEANPQEQTQNIVKKNSEGLLSHKESGISHKSLEQEQEQLFNKNKEPGLDSNNINQNVNTNNINSQNVDVGMSSVQNIGKSEMENVEINNVNNIEANLNNNDNPFESKINNEEFPIEEKMPEQNNVNENDNHQEEMNQNQLEGSVDIDENLAHLPTINSIMKGRGDLLPPPKKKKYQ